MVSDKFNITDLPNNVILLPAAEKDLAKILRKNLKEFKQIFQDIARLGQGTLPPAGRKKLKLFDAWQMDAGRFRIVYRFTENRYSIFAVFAKPDQKKRFKAM